MNRDRTDANEGYKKKLACAKAARRDDTFSAHSISGSCTSSDLYANWDDEGLLHLVHPNQPDYDNEMFPSAKPLLFTGCLLERGHFREKDKEEIVPMSMKLSFRKEEGRPDEFTVDGDGMIFFDHFDLRGRATKTQSTNHHQDEYRLELEVAKADEVGG